MILTILKYASGPVIGAVIGYFTNFIAVKMLFYPRKPVMFFGHKLPFTPGVIPKGKPRLAKAIGKAVGENLITKEDLTSMILSEQVTSQISQAAIDQLNKPIKDAIMHVTNLPEEMYNNGKNKLSDLLSDEILGALSKVNISSLIVEKVGPLLTEKIQNPMIRMFITPELINSMAEPIGVEIQNIITTDGTAYVKPLLLNKIENMEEGSAIDLLSKANVSEMMMKGIISSILSKMLTDGVNKLTSEIDISGVVESKINDMDIDELEKLILQVMKKELNTIVNLGALIGLILGLINILFKF